MSGFSAFAAADQPRPTVSTNQARTWAEELFGVTGSASALGSAQDANFRIRTDEGDYVLKVANPAFGSQLLDLENAAIAHLASRLDLAVPEVVATAEGAAIQEVQLGGRAHHIRLINWLGDTTLADFTYLAEPVVRSVGETAARCAEAMVGFRHEALHRTSQWDTRRGIEVVAELSASISDPEVASRVTELTRTAAELLEPIAGQLPVQPIHGDLADYNLMAAPGADGRPVLTAVIDFGDVLTSWRVAELAVAVSSLLWRDPRSPVEDLAIAAAGFHAVSPLSEAEVVALWPLVMLRTAVLMASVERQLAVDPGNAYAADERPLDWRILERVAPVPPAIAEEVVRDRLGLAPSRRAIAMGSWMVEQAPHAVRPIQSHRSRVVDLSASSPQLVDGAWMSEPALGDLLHSDAYCLVGRHGEPRLHRAAPDAAVAPATTHLGVDLFVAAGTAVFAPIAGAVTEVDPGSVHLLCDGVELLLAGVDAEVATGRSVGAGEPLGRVSAHSPDPPLPPHVHIQALDPQVELPRYLPPWAVSAGSLSPDPTPLLGGLVDIDPVSHATPNDLLGARDRIVASVQEHYYAEPPLMVRGWRQHLFDAGARAYLDMVNNVTVLGHSHPAVAQAASRQLQLLNTNSRFHYEPLVRFAERLVELTPPGLDSVLFVNSGSEAVDLALRLIRSATGRRDVIALRGGYHGWTTATDEITTSLNDNPIALRTRPPWIHLADMPNTFRGTHRGADTASRYAVDLRELIAVMVADGVPPAGYVAEALSGNAGGVLLPDGYLADAYAAVRAAGGLAVADEVQVGYGRTGAHFWHFEAHGVVPDVVTAAKAVGNGYPIGVVITRPEIAEALGSEGSFFSSVGGSPVSCAVGLAVLDTLESEQLQANAATVGERLRGRLEELRDRHPLIGAVHGVGLYLGIELVRDRDTLQPATEEAYAICDRLLELGVICQPTGDYSNVLKVKPPLCITDESADFFVDMLDRALGEGW